MPAFERFFSINFVLRLFTYNLFTLDIYVFFKLPSYPLTHLGQEGFRNIQVFIYSNFMVKNKFSSK